MAGQDRALTGGASDGKFRAITLSQAGGTTRDGGHRDGNAGRGGDGNCLSAYPCLTNYICQRLSQASLKSHLPLPPAWALVEGDSTGLSSSLQLVNSRTSQTLKCGRGACELVSCVSEREPPARPLCFFWSRGGGRSRLRSKCVPTKSRMYSEPSESRFHSSSSSDPGHGTPCQAGLTVSNSKP